MGNAEDQANPSNTSLISFNKCFNFIYVIVYFPDNYVDFEYFSMLFEEVPFHEGV